jgi:hypothetical protein
MIAHTGEASMVGRRSGLKTIENQDRQFVRMGGHHAGVTAAHRVRLEFSRKFPPRLSQHRLKGMKLI